MSDLVAGVWSSGNFDIGTEEAAEPGVIWTLLRPVDFSEFRVDG